MLALKFIGIIIVSYLFGTISISPLVAKQRKVDIVSVGSGNAGATNMLRNVGVVPAIIILVFDALKCILPCLGAYYLLGGTDSWFAIFREIAPEIASIGVYTAATSCVIGHMFPVWRKFKGGKGVACGFGLACFAQPILTAILFAIYLVIIIVVRIGSVGSLFAALSFIITDCVLLILDGYYASFALALSILLLVVWAHRANILRLIKRKENVIDLNKSVQMDIDHYTHKHDNNKDADNK